MAKEKTSQQNGVSSITSSPTFKHSALSVQLELLQENLPSGAIQPGDMSNTVDFWDQIPKYFVDMRKQTSLRDENGKLPSITRDFVHRGLHWKVALHPARLLEDGKEIEYLPGPTEELVEEALRRMSIIDGHEHFTEEDAHGKFHYGVRFTLYGLAKELGSRGHTLCYRQLIKSLYILNGCRIEVFGTAGRKRAEIHTAVITDIVAVGVDDWNKDPKASWSVYFSASVAEAIKAQHYRKIDYGSVMDHKSQLSRWIHRRLTSQYKQASMLNTYNINLSTIERDSGMLDVKGKYKLRKLERSLDELKTAKIIDSYEYQNVQRGRWNAISDMKITLKPHRKFIEIAKETNLLLKQSSPTIAVLKKEHSR